jgi:hypothetical protein
MTLREACDRAQKLNREQEVRGTHTRFVVVADPIGSADCNHQVIARRVGRLTRRS